MQVAIETRHMFLSTIAFKILTVANRAIKRQIYYLNFSIRTTFLDIFTILDRLISFLAILIH